MKTQNNKSFKYTYSSREQEELRKIRQKYEKGEEDKLARIRALDKSVGQKSTVISLIVGIVGALMLGFGMSLIMTNLGDSLKLGTVTTLSLGVTLGILGAALAATAYPIYNALLKKERKAAAPEILKLTDELLK